MNNNATINAQLFYKDNVKKTENKSKESQCHL